MKKIPLILLLSLLAVSCGKQTHFARVENGRFIVGESTVYDFAGTNFWYGPILASPGKHGDRDRLHKELDRLQEIGVDNLRILVGAEGEYGKRYKIEPILQPEPGIYDDDMLDGLDYLMAELDKRGMYAVLYLTNSWEWSGGYGQYLEWCGQGEYPIPGLDGWNTYVDYVGEYFKPGVGDSCATLLKDHITKIVGRTNRYTGKPYSEDTAIFAWQLCNEPRPFSKENKDAFAEWVEEMARHIKSLDPNHMVSTGSEGEVGCERDIELWRRIHSIPEIDYAVIHAWPYTWRWFGRDEMEEKLPQTKEMLRTYINDHVALMEPLGKPVVLEEFGFHRDGYRFEPGTPTSLRDSFYGFVFELQAESIAAGGLFRGSNFWGWSGYADLKPGQMWAPGDDYTVDPAHEEQGLYSVFAGDTTCDIIKVGAARIRAAR